MANLATMLIGLERFNSGLKRRVIQVGDHRVVYSEGGHGEPVVLLHGFGASADSWNRFAKPLTKRYRVIAPHGMVEPQPSELFRDVAKGDNWLVATTRQEFDRLLNNAFAKRPYAPKAVLNYLADHAIRNSAKSAKIFAEMQTNDPPLAQRLPNITAPAMIVWGDLDRILHVSCADL